MAADVKTQTSVLRINISDYPRCLEIETATNASAKTLSASGGQCSWTITIKYEKKMNDKKILKYIII
jgi:hypothetical protein